MKLPVAPTRRLLVLTAALTLALATGAQAVIVDGRFDPAEGYTSHRSVSFTVQDSLLLIMGGDLWLHQDPGSGDLYLLFSQPKILVDNTYGVNAIGWGSEAPSGKNHKFGDLKGSDKAQFAFTDGDGNLVLDVIMDYFSETSKGSGVYDCLGVTGGDGKVITGSASSVTAWASSLDYNFNNLGFVLTTDSPATDDNYTENPSYAGWIYDVMYELCLSGDLFAGAGFGDVNIGIVHDSPNKIGKNEVYPELHEPDDVIPEPLCSVLFVGSVLLGLIKRRRLN